MGNRKDWTDVQLQTAVNDADGNLTLAARTLNTVYKDDIKAGTVSKVTRQNLQTWTDDTPVVEQTDNFHLLKANRRLGLKNTELRRSLTATESVLVSKDTVLQNIKDAVSGLPDQAPTLFWPPQPKGKKITIELLFSDLQIGKIMNDYDSKVARRRVDEWVTEVLSRIRAYNALGYEVEKIVLALLGDIIESDKKHGHQSAVACDIGTADQIKQAVELLYHHVLRRFEEVGVPIDVIAITGNHDWDGHGMSMFKPGKEQLSWPLYHAVRELCEASDMNVTWVIPEGAFHIYELYGNYILYEHGVGVTAAYNNMKQHLAKRTDQFKKYIALFRMGDKHNISQFNNNRYVVNGAFFGDSRGGEEYSGIAGYDGEPAQIMFAHVQRTDDYRTTIYDSFAIQVGHIK